MSSKHNLDESRIDLIEKTCIPCAIFTYKDNRVVMYAVSQGFLDLFECNRETADEYLNNRIYDNVHPDDVARMGDAAISFATEGGEYDLVFRVKINERYQIIHAKGRHVYSMAGERLAIVWYSDVGIYEGRNQDLYENSLENVMQNSKLEEGGYDSMTGLPSTEYFYKLAEIARAKHLANGDSPVLLYFDFNDMKNYNLKYGFSEGDRLISGMARILADHYANINCCRFGGDHFAAVTKEGRVEEELSEIFEEVKELNGGKSLFVRVGIYANSMGEVSTGVACDRAKMACDVNRDSVESVYNYFNEDLFKKSQRTHYILENLDRAIEEEWLQVYYQPLIRAVNGKVSDEEALVRWIDPVMGFMSPADFIPVLEDARLLYKLDLYVLECVINKMKVLESNNLHLVPCSLNISRYDFESCDIVEEIRKRVDASGIGRDKFTIEITESAVGANVEYIQKQVELFNELGFKVWMDDFGSGYSSPDVLQNVSFNTIKLDMMFMRQFDSNEKSRVIIRQLINMAQNLGLETVVEGVETKEQAEFLIEAGATKLQGYYFCKPISLDNVLERYEKGSQIGFENPKESEYYASVGNVNLYKVSLSSYVNDEEDYTTAIPMSVYEVKDEEVAIIRCNKSYRKFVKDAFDVDDVYHKLTVQGFLNDYNDGFIGLMVRCAKEGRQVIEDRVLINNFKVHMLMRRISLNPVTKAAAVAVVLLEVKKDYEDVNGLSFGDIAEALSSDYLNLYYVNVETEQYTEFKPDVRGDNILAERHGENFFSRSREDALRYLYKDDQESFISTFNKECVLSSIEQSGTYTNTYRLLIDGKDTYVNMKATPMRNDPKHLIIGVNNVDVQMRQQEAFDRIKEERVAFSRISALAGNYIAFYTIDLKNDTFYEYDASGDYESVGAEKEGVDFFKSARRQVKGMIYEEDYEMFMEVFTRERVLSDIEEDGIFALKYRIMINGAPRYIYLKIVKIVEDEKELLLVGVNDIDDRVKREQDYAYKLAAARNKVNLDPLTGVKNKNAYLEIEAGVNKTIKERTCAAFAVVVFDINNLKETNDIKGHAAGDELIKDGCALICTTFRHSPVFRIGGDEFVAIVRGEDYSNRDELLKTFKDVSLKNKKDGKVVVAGGMSIYNNDDSLEDVFKRADAAMYSDKRALKA